MKFHIYNFIKASEGSVKRIDLLHHIRMQMNDVNISDRVMRKTIEEMIIEDGYLIQSSEKGYSIIKTQEQLDKAVKYLNAKAEAIAIRKNVLLKNWEHKKQETYGHQPSLF